MKSGKNAAVWRAVLIAAIAVLVVCVGLFIHLFVRRPINQDDFKKTTPSAQSSSKTGKLAKNPINFTKLQKVNDEVYAWITVPNTKVDYPVAQCRKSDDYYMDHNYMKEYDPLGTIFTEKRNSMNFDDPNTVLYGHNTYSGQMFRSLYNFKDADFFNKNRKFYIYLPGRKLTYEVFAAYEYDDRDILYSFDFSDKKVYAQYLKDCKNPISLTRNVKQDVELTVNDKIVTLYTCMAGIRHSRYLVQGVLIKDEQTAR